MNIICCPYNYFHQPLAGGELYLTRLLNHLKKAHNIRIICGTKEPYIHNGIECFSQGENVEMFIGNNEHFKWADVIITQLIGTAYGYNKMIQHKKPLIFIAHNNSKLYAVRHAQQHECHVVYNSYQLRDDLAKDFGHFNSTVLHPLLPDVKKKSEGQYITLINCNHNKGGHIFAEIASRLPQFQFLGVFGGYGEQIEAHLPNVTYLPNGCDIEAVYKSTRVLLVPSEFESFSQCAIEAMQYGIPVIAHPCPGIKENLSEAGLFVDRNNIEKYCEVIVYLINNSQAWQRQSEASLERVRVVKEKSKLELDRFDQWISKIK